MAVAKVNWMKKGISAGEKLTKLIIKNQRHTALVDWVCPFEFSTKSELRVWRRQVNSLSTRIEAEFSCIIFSEVSIAPQIQL